MRFVNYVKQEYDEIIQSLENYLANSDTCDQNCRMEDISEILDRIRSLQLFELNSLYPYLKPIVSLKSVLEKAESEHKTMEEYIENIIFIHVDEPEHLHMVRVSELRIFLERMKQTDFILLDTCPSYLSEAEGNTIDKQIMDSQAKSAELAHSK